MLDIMSAALHISHALIQWLLAVSEGWFCNVAIQLWKLHHYILT